jgi:hypothetical protein
MQKHLRILNAAIALPVSSIYQKAVVSVPVITQSLKRITQLPRQFPRLVSLSDSPIKRFNSDINRALVVLNCSV